MTVFLTSGSSVERALLCPSSVALPHAHYESPYTTRGTMIHAFLEACASVGRDDALSQLADESDRDICAELVLDGLEHAMSLAAEVAIAYDVETDTARELGRGMGRAYDDVGINEIPCTLDVVGSRVLASGLERGLVIDYKTGWTTRRPVAAVVQLDFGALAASRAYGLDLCEVQIVNVYEGFAPHVERRTIEAWELDAFASELRERHREWKQLREQWRSGILPREFNTGPWCERCGSREFCPAQTSLLREVLSKDLFDGLMRMDPIPDSALASAWRQVHEAQSVLSLVKGRILGVAATRKIFLGLAEDGKERWLGTQISEGNDKLDGEAVFDVVAELHGDDVATKATKVVATKSDLDAAVKSAVPRGTKASALKRIYERLRAIPGAITNKTSVGVKEFALHPLAIAEGQDAEAERRRVAHQDGPRDLPEETERAVANLPSEEPNAGT